MDNPTVRDLRGENARLRKQVIKLEEEKAFLQGEIRGIGHRKLAGDDVKTTTDKIKFAIEKNSQSWIWYRDRVLAPTLAALHTGLVFALLYLAFEKGLHP